MDCGGGCNVWIRRGGCCEVCGVAIGGMTLAFKSADEESAVELSNSVRV